MPNKLEGHTKYSLREQAKKYIAARANRGQSKASGAILRSDRTVQRYQGDLARAAEFIQQKFGIKKLKDITHAQAQAYIDIRLKENVRIKTVQGYAKALSLLPLVKQLSVPSRGTDQRDKPKRSRAYTKAQIIEIQRQINSSASRLAVQIMIESGCRAQDLASLRLETERPLKNARLELLHPDRFVGREDWMKVTFIGKGGHEYASSISPATAETLRHYRLSSAREFRERGQENVVAYQLYDLPAGWKLSCLWTNASKHTLGFSHGAHGLRHSFAQERVKTLQVLGMTWQKALECVSQQMGHYRAEQVRTCYLR